MSQLTPPRRISLSPLQNLLTKGSQFQPSQPRKSVRAFFRHNLTKIFALLAGLVCTIACIVLTFWLSNQVLYCPEWSTNCQISGRVEYIRTNIGTVQGLVTAVYAVGLAAMAYAAHAFSEAALWPLLRKQPLTLKQVESYI
jgi:hypothetical protein